MRSAAPSSVADPDPAFHFDVDPDPTFQRHSDADPDPAFHFNEDPDPASQSDAYPCRSGSEILAHSNRRNMRKEIKTLQGRKTQPTKSS